MASTLGADVTVSLNQGHIQWPHKRTNFLQKNLSNDYFRKLSYGKLKSYLS